MNEVSRFFQSLIFPVYLYPAEKYWNMGINWSPKLIVAYVFGFTITVAAILSFVAIEYGKSVSGARISMSSMDFISLPAYATFILLFFVAIGYFAAKIIEFLNKHGRVSNNA